jgi:hypothetical protein
MLALNHVFPTGTLLRWSTATNMFLLHWAINPIVRKLRRFDETSAVLRYRVHTSLGNCI